MFVLSASAPTRDCCELRCRAVQIDCVKKRLVCDNEDQLCVK